MLKSATTYNSDANTCGNTNTRFRRIAVIGLGYVGLPTAILFARAGLEVVGVDIDQSVVDCVNSAISPIAESGVSEALKSAVAEGRLVASLFPQQADAFIVTVPTPLRKGASPEPEMAFVHSAMQSIASVLRSSNLVILESTSPVGATRECVELIGRLRPDLKMPGADGDGDVDFAYSPERVLPGRALFELVHNSRVVGGVTPRAARRAASLFTAFVEGDCVLTDDRSAEMVKLSENIFRDVNIALANELSMICDQLNLDTLKVIELANRHPRVQILSPGTGVGGHCIPIDPWFVVAQAPGQARLIRTAREVNEEKTRHVFRAICSAAEQNPSSRIACFGLAYKADVDDFRESPSLELALDLTERFGDRVMAVEPYAATLRKRDNRALRLKFVATEEAVRSADILAMLVGHSPFKAIPIPRDKVIIDSVGLWRRQ